MDPFSSRSPEPSLRSSVQSVQTRLTAYTEGRSPDSAQDAPAYKFAVDRDRTLVGTFESIVEIPVPAGSDLGLILLVLVLVLVLALAAVGTRVSRARSLRRVPHI